jgi:aminoglycoside phosphotransferase (APT) family kinase protein
VLRVLDQAWLTAEPDAAAHEAAALEQAETLGLRAPRLVAYTANDSDLAAPLVLMTFIPGAIELRPLNFQSWLAGLAAELAAIQRHTAHSLAWHYGSWVKAEVLRPPAWTTKPAMWERAIEIFSTDKPEVQPVFIHRDYHPTNVLWSAGAVSGVVDWINACQGPAGVDVAHCRTNLALMFGPQAAAQFLQIYCEVAQGFTYPTFWDVDSVFVMIQPQQTFYPTLQEFVLGHLEPERLQQGIDADLERVMRWG